MPAWCDHRCGSGRRFGSLQQLPERKPSFPQGGGFRIQVFIRCDVVRGGCLFQRFRQPFQIVVHITFSASNFRNAPNPRLQ